MITEQQMRDIALANGITVIDRQFVAWTISSSGVDSNGTLGTNNMFIGFLSVYQENSPGQVLGWRPFQYTTQQLGVFNFNAGSTIEMTNRFGLYVFPGGQPGIWSMSFIGWKIVFR